MTATPCQADPAAWFADDAATRRRAAMKCNACPILAECFTLGKGEQGGVWGGVDRTPRRPTGAGPNASYTYAEIAAAFAVNPSTVEIAAQFGVPIRTVQRAVASQRNAAA